MPKIPNPKKKINVCIACGGKKKSSSGHDCIPCGGTGKQNGGSGYSVNERK